MPLIDQSALRLDEDCHTIAISEPLSRSEAESLAGALKAVADPTRLQLLSMISGSAAGEACVCDLTAPLGLTQPTVSHHLTILVEAGLLSRERRGKWAWYAIVPERLDALRSLLP
ncbi:metalloregulator ArsR/SmtB family transcription factor [Nonomuraea africana]|uniref:ArsR family transcriptional regulator n=1 Tax=Nonomuraea africana TaxID=46171 RepID=A0ABR9KV72_9ACTN|nr:metalloregulator ArsR/SmtB family transcription factor [Nonomuraea africana]MBE1565939.1 ArsR family transcriptional regulator [Nonomuraea africana]